MNHEDVGRYWNDNADAWTRLAREGYDVYRDRLNTPEFFEMLPETAGLNGLDVGCGEGHNTRLLADRGAKMTAIDISERFVDHARAAEAEEPRGIDYRVASAVALPFGDETFDFATGFMSYMDIPEKHRSFLEAWRVLKPGGFLQISITHPCFDTPRRRNIRDASGRTYAVEIGDYFSEVVGQIDEWIFKAAPEALKRDLPRFRTPRFRLTLSAWLNLIIETGFTIERVGEPKPSDAVAESVPGLHQARVVAFFLHILARKPARTGP